MPTDGILVITTVKNVATSIARSSPEQGNIVGAIPNHMTMNVWGSFSKPFVKTPHLSGRDDMKEMIERIAKALVDQPELVSVREVGGMHSSILELTVAKADIGKVIGKQGRTVSALRTLLGAVSSKAKKRIVLTVVE